MRRLKHDGLLRLSDFHKHWRLETEQELDRLVERSVPGHNDTSTMIVTNVFESEDVEAAKVDLTLACAVLTNRKLVQLQLGPLDYLLNQARSVPIVSPPGASQLRPNELQADQNELEPAGTADKKDTMLPLVRRSA